MVLLWTVPREHNCLRKGTFIFIYDVSISSETNTGFFESNFNLLPFLWFLMDNSFSTRDWKLHKKESMANLGDGVIFRFYFFPEGNKVKNKQTKKENIYSQPITI